MVKIYKVKKFSPDIEPHEVFLDKMAQREEESSGLSEKKFEVPLREKISYALFGFFFLLALVLFSKVFYFQYFEGQKLYVQAQNNKGSVNLIVPARGVVYDKNMKQLVLNSPAYDLICERSRFSLAGQAFSSQEVSSEIKKIAGAISLEPLEVFNKIQGTTSAEVLVANNLTHEQLLLLEEKISELKGCKIQKNTVRNYVLGPVFSHVLGYTGRINKEEYSTSSGYAINDYVGKTGLEKYYESELRGKAGQLKSVGVEPESGNNLVLNIDAGLQIQLYNELENTIKKMGAQKGAAVAMDPRTGAVLSLVSYPSYDDNLFSGGISQTNFDKITNDISKPLFNRAVSAQYPTGSTIKPFEASAALQENIISPEKLINDPGYILIQSQYDPNIVYAYGGVAPHGWVDMRKAIAVSSNIYFYTIGGGYEDQQGLGPQRIKQYLSLFGWDQKTGIDLPGEFSGFIPDPAWKKSVKGQPWWDGDTYNLSIGQSDLQTTPLQVASAYCAIANGGYLYRPQILNKILDPQGNIVAEFEPQIIRSGFIDLENLEVVKQGMRDAVTESYGLSHMLNSLPVSSAAKTGTAEIGYQNRFNVWSSVFAPYENPEIVLVITVEEVSGLGAVTLPVARDVLNWYFTKK